MGTSLFIIILLYQISQQTAVPAPGILFNKLFPQNPTTASAPMLPFVGIINSLAGIIPSASNLLPPGSSPGIPQSGQASGTSLGQTPGVSSPVFPIPGITAPLFPGLSGLLPGQPSVQVPAPATVSGTPGYPPGTTPGAGIAGIIPAITAPLLPGISAIISSIQTPLAPATSTSNGTTASPTTLAADQLKSQLDAAKLTYIQNGLAYGIALAHQVITGFFQGLLNPTNTTTANIQSG